MTIKQVSSGRTSQLNSQWQPKHRNLLFQKIKSYKAEFQNQKNQKELNIDITFQKRKSKLCQH